MGARKWKDPELDVELTIQEQKFVRLYIFGGDGVAGIASACYRLVYGQKEDMSNDSVWHHASKMTSKPRIREAIRQLNEKDITKEAILRRIIAIADKPSAKDADRLRASELLGKSEGLFIEKSEVNIKTDTLFTVEDDK